MNFLMPLARALMSRYRGPETGQGGGFSFGGAREGMGELGRALGSLLNFGGTRASPMGSVGPTSGGYRYPAPPGPRPPENVSMPGSEIAGGTAPWMSGMLPYTQPGARVGGRAGNSTGAVAWLLNRAHDSAGDAIGFMRRN